MRAYSRVRLGIMRGLLRAAPGLRRVAAGYAAKAACSNLFVAGRDLPSVLAEDLQGIPGVAIEVDEAERRVRARAHDTWREAVYQPGLGARLLHPRGKLELPPAPVEARPPLDWPRGEGTPGLEAALDEAFAERDPRRPRRTRAVVVIHRGELVAERYGPGFGPDSRLLGWSMTKSLVNALVGVLAQRGVLDVHAPLGAPEWTSSDPRAAITWDQCLRMSSGLRFWEQYWNPASHVATMLFDQPNAAAYAAELPLVAEPDTHWSYASGTSNLLARALFHALSGDRAAYQALPREGLFEPLGMRSALMETDAAGHFVGSSFSYATARDWARFGQLYLQDGAWDGQQILPPGWVADTVRPTPAAPLGEYGRHFWLNAGNGRRPAKRLYPTLPADAFFARGHEEQSVSIIPSREAVIVRLGQTADHSAWNLERFVRDVLAGLPA